MSTLAITTLQDRASSDNAPVLDAVHGSARAWVNFNGTGTVSIIDSYNVSSITDNGTGNYTVNFTNNLQDANYGAVGMLQAVASGAVTVSAATSGIRTSSSFQVYALTSSASLSDSPSICLAFLR